MPKAKAKPKPKTKAKPKAKAKAKPMVVEEQPPAAEPSAADDVVLHDPKLKEVPGYDWIFSPHRLSPWLRRRPEMPDREKMIDLLGTMFAQAARASVAKGAQYAPGENISTDAEGAWRVVAETLIRIAENNLGAKNEVAAKDGA